MFYLLTYLVDICRHWQSIRCCFVICSTADMWSDNSAGSSIQPSVLILLLILICRLNCKLFSTFTVIVFCTSFLLVRMSNMAYCCCCCCYCCCYLCRLAIKEGIVVVGVCLSLSVCLSVWLSCTSLSIEPRLRAHCISLRSEGHALYPVLSCCCCCCCCCYNNNNKHENVHGAVIVAEPLREFTRLIW